MATRDDAATVERDARAVLLMAAELVARARQGALPDGDLAALSSARQLLAKRFAKDSKTAAERELWPVVESITAVYRQAPPDVPPKVLEGALTDALSQLGFRADARSLATLAAEHERKDEHQGASEAAKVAVGKVGPSLVNERRTRFGLETLAFKEQSKNTVASWRHLLPPTPATGKAHETALELLASLRSEDTLDDALAELLAPTDVEAERAWIAQAFPPADAH